MTHLHLQTRHLPRICYAEVKSIKSERHLRGVLAFSIWLSLCPEGKRVKWTCRSTLVAELQAPLISFAFWRTWEAFLFMDVSMFTVMIEWREGFLGTCIQMCCWHKEAAYSFKRADPRNKPFFTLQLWTHRIQDPMTQHLARRLDQEVDRLGKAERSLCVLSGLVVFAKRVKMKDLWAC